MANNSRKSNAMRYAKESENTNQFIDKCYNTNRKRKSYAMQNVYNRVVKTQKPVTTGMGIVNPAKLDLSNLKNLKSLSKGKDHE